MKEAWALQNVVDLQIQEARKYYLLVVNSASSLSSPTAFYML